MKKCRGMFASQFCGIFFMLQRAETVYTAVVRTLCSSSFVCKEKVSLDFIIKNSWKFFSSEEIVKTLFKLEAGVSVM
jgi:hypothetical protein